MHGGQIYHRIYNKAFDELFLRLRGQFGGESILMKDTLRRILTLRKQEKKVMIGFIIWVIGEVLAVKAVLEIMRWPVDGVKKLLVAIIILLTSWIGICVYYFWGRENLPQILK